MARAPDGYGVGGGVTVTPVKLRAGWQALVDEARIRGSAVGAARRAFSPEEELLLVEGRKAGLAWSVICKELRCAEDTARRHYRELVGAP